MQEKKFEKRETNNRQMKMNNGSSVLSQQTRINAKSAKLTIKLTIKRLGRISPWYQMTPCKRNINRLIKKGTDEVKRTFHIIPI